MTDVVIASAARTAVGSFSGGLSGVPAHELGATAIKAALARAGVAGGDVGEVILGQVLQAAQGQNPARQASMAAGVPIERPAMGINQVCGSGLRAVALAANAVKTGDATIALGGGQEDMSLSPHAGQTTENLAQKYQISRAEQDAFAVASQNKAEAAKKAGKFKDEIAPVTIKTRKGEVIFDQDEYIRDGATIDGVSGLRPAFVKDGTVTAANASGINDGAAALVVMSAKEADKRGIKPLARIASFAHCGVDPSIMGIGPAPASRMALEKAGWKLEDLDLIEAKEAFAAQALAVGKELGWNPEKVNVNGGAIAIGHPIGASGARILTTLLYEMNRSGARKGLATLCIGGGMGVAMCVEKA